MIRTRSVWALALCVALLAACGEGGFGPSAPPTPAGLTMAAHTETTISLSWSASLGAVAYELRRSELQSLSSASQVYLGPALGFVDTELKAGTTYYYWVRAISSSAASEYSEAVVASTAAATAAPATPGGLRLVTSTASTLELAWDAEANASSYELYIDTSQSGAFATRAYAGIGTSCVVESLESDRTYYFKVLAKGLGGSSPLSAALAADTTSGVPTAPTGFKVTGSGTTYIVLAWEEAAEAVEYVLLRSDSADGEYSEVYRGTALSREDSGLDDQTQYLYKLYAVGSVAGGPAAGPISWTTGEVPATVTGE
jgi:fibronectin type 3 domain-containing protein